MRGGVVLVLLLGAGDSFVVPPPSCRALSQLANLHDERAVLLRRELAELQHFRCHGRHPVAVLVIERQAQGTRALQRSLPSQTKGLAARGVQVSTFMLSVHWIMTPLFAWQSCEAWWSAAVTFVVGGLGSTFQMAASLL